MTARLVCLLLALAGAAATAQAPRTVPDAELPSGAVPATGPLGERELVLLAIAHRPELEKLRAAVQVAAAQRRASGDLENPELRLSYAHDRDGRLTEPYTELETLQVSSSEGFDSLRTTTSLAQPGEPGFGEATTVQDTGNTDTSRLRIIERRVIPGATRDIVEENIYETTDRSTTSTRLRSESGAAGVETRSDSRDTTESRRLVGTSREEILHPSSTEEDNTWGLLCRFRLPHPWERKARIRRAAAEVAVAEAAYYAEEDKVVRLVRGACQDLAVMVARLDAERLRKTHCERFRDWLEEQRNPQLGLELAAARAKVHATIAAIRRLEAETAAARDELAAYCGLGDSSRIQPVIIRRTVTTGLDLDYLTNLAMLYRGDVLDSQARLALAKAELAQSKAGRIPFASFLDLGYAETETLRRSGQNQEWFVRSGISVPLWDWLGVNKQHRVHETSAAAWERQIARLRTAVANEVSLALKRLKTVEAQLDTQTQDLTALKSDMDRSLQDAEAATADINDVLKGKRIENDFQDLIAQMEISRYATLSVYQEALLALEKALGVRLERALTRGAGE